MILSNFTDRKLYFIDYQNSMNVFCIFLKLKKEEITMKKTFYNPGILMLLCLLILNAASVKSADVIVTVNALLDTKLTSVDSIIVVNESNNTTLKLGDMSQSSLAYRINLSSGVVETLSENLSVNISDKIMVNTNISGINVLAVLNEPQQLKISVIGIDGKLIDMKNVLAQNGSNVVDFKLNQAGIYLVHVFGPNLNSTSKILFNPANATLFEPIATLVKIKSNVQGFSYTEGNRIQLVVKKGSVKSPVWYGKPVNGTLIRVSVPKYTQVFDMKQTLSRGAQINTISFSGVAFFSGCFYASTFYPPGKVADYFGFQYMRDNDPDESGHNTDFLTKAAYHMMHILNSNQLQELINLAVQQDSLFTAYAMNRLILIKAFHRFLDSDLPAGTTGLNPDSVKALSRKLYQIDAEISYGRAIKFAEIINSLTEEQRDTLYRLGATGMQVWTMPAKPQVSIPKDMNTWVMSNASELFSWFLRGVDADIYFCPERQGTYFGGFYMKDAPAVGNPGYGIDMEATANKGAYLLDSLLTPTQSTDVKNIYTQVSPALTGIVQCRTLISTELRKAISGQTINKNDIINWSNQYGEFDGNYIYSMVSQFVKVSRTLTQEQKNKLVVLRDLAAYSCKADKVFLYSAEINEPVLPNTDFLFK